MQPINRAEPIKPVCRRCARYLSLPIVEFESMAACANCGLSRAAIKRYFDYYLQDRLPRLLALEERITIGAMLILLAAYSFIAITQGDQLDCLARVLLTTGFIGLGVLGRYTIGLAMVLVDPMWSPPKLRRSFKVLLMAPFWAIALTLLAPLLNLFGSIFLE